MQSQFNRITLFKNITLGTFKHVNDLHGAITRDNFMTSGAAELLSPHFELARETQTVQLVALSLSDLGLQGGAPFCRVYARGKELGLALCPSEVGPQLRLEHQEQPLGESLIIAMEPIKNRQGIAAVFVVEHISTGRWLTTTSAHPKNNWYGNDRRWIFSWGADGAIVVSTPR